VYVPAPVYVPPSYNSYDTSNSIWVDDSNTYIDDGTTVVDDGTPAADGTAPPSWVGVTNGCLGVHGVL
jgi:hypothetical protein